MGHDYYAWHYGPVHYLRRGLGDPLLLVHGIYPGADHCEFEYNIDAMASRFCVHAIDLLGFGDSHAPHHKYSAQTYIELVFDFLREVVGRPAGVVAAGLSCAYVAEVAGDRKSVV